MPDKKIVKYAVAGVLIGFAGFITSIATMGGVFYRPDPEGKPTFTLQGFWEYIKSPFRFGSIQFQTVWAAPKNVTLPLKKRFKLWSMNWVLWTIGGALAGLLTYSVVSGINVINMGAQNDSALDTSGVQS